MKNRIIPLVAALLAFAVLFTACSANKTETDANKTQTGVSDTSEAVQNEPSFQPEETHNVFGNFTAETPWGEKTDSSVFEGKITMVSIWAVISEHSVRQLSDLERLSKEYADRNFQVVGIVSDVYLNSDGSCDVNDVEEVKTLLENKGISFINLLPNEALVKAKLGDAKYIPETIFLDEKGNMIGGNYTVSKSYEDWCDIVDSVLLR